MLIQLKSAEFRYGDVTIFQNASLDINEGDSIGLVGANGSGKSTLLSCLAEGATLFSGSLFVKNGLKIGYLKQNADFASDRTLFDEMMSVFDYQTGLLSQLDFIASELSRADFGSEEYKVLSEKYHRLTVEADAGDAYSCKVKVNTVLNGMGFSAFGDRIVSSLSGGEKTKAALCKLLLQRPELMILDEPTNHLDLESREALEDALKEFSGTVLFVSHDRYFLNAVAQNTMAFADGQCRFYEGNYDDYLEATKSVGLPQKSEESAVRSKTAVSGNYRSAKQRAELVKARASVKEYEAQISRLEQVIERLNIEISDPEVASDYEILMEKCRELEHCKAELDQAYACWEEAAARLEELNG